MKTTPSNLETIDALPQRQAVAVRNIQKGSFGPFHYVGVDERLGIVLARSHRDIVIGELVAIAPSPPSVSIIYTDPDA